MPFGMLHSCSADFGSGADIYQPVDIRGSLSAPKIYRLFLKLKGNFVNLLVIFDLESLH